MIDLLESYFSEYKVKIAQLNMCYNIEDVVSLNAELDSLVKLKGEYKLHLKREMKERGIKKRQIL